MENFAMPRMFWRFLVYHPRIDGLLPPRCCRLPIILPGCAEGHAGLWDFGLLVFYCIFWRHPLGSDRTLPFRLLCSSDLLFAWSQRGKIALFIFPSYRTYAGWSCTYKRHNTDLSDLFDIFFSFYPLRLACTLVSVFFSLVFSVALAYIHTMFQIGAWEWFRRSHMIWICLGLCNGWTYYLFLSILLFVMMTSSVWSLPVLNDIYLIDTEWTHLVNTYCNN